MGILEGQVAIITGAGRGLGREHALLLAREGARVVVNDVGGAIDGGGSDSTPAEQVVAEIEAMGGQAVANADNVADWDGARRLVDTALDVFGDLTVLVNNAGILRDRTLVNMSEADWDDVMRVHLKGTFCPTRWAAEYWRQQSKKTDGPVRAAVVNTSSGSGLHGNPGQANYAAAKAGIAAFTTVTAKELGRYGVKVNAIAPVARTRMTEATPGLGDVMKPRDDGFDVWDPANISPLVAYLASDECTFTGQVFSVVGGKVGIYQSWSVYDEVDNDGRWEPVELATAVKKFPAEVEVRVQSL